MADSEKKVMIIDGESKILSTAKKLLAPENYKLLLASDPDDALEIIDENEPVAVVVCDNKLSTMRGTEFLEKLKGLDPDTTRILMTGSYDSQLIEDVVNTSEVFRFVKKPLDFKILIRTIRAGIEENERILKLKSELAERERLITQKTETESEKTNLNTQIKGLVQGKKQLVYIMIVMILMFGVFEAYTIWAKNVKLEDTSQKIGSWIKYTNGTAKDTKTNLMWMTRDFRIIERRQPYNWGEAMSWVKKINTEHYGGYSDWRVPTIAEYQAIFDEKGTRLAYDQKKNFPLGVTDAFEIGGGYGFWSNEEMGEKSARYFFFVGGYSKTDLKTYNNPTISVRLVRD
jgi:FixJ family two-component response regulator